MPMSKLVLIDGNAILHRAYHALPVTLTTRKGQPINAVYGFVSMLLRIITDLKPTHLIVTFDRKEPTFRHKEFKEYQSHRPETDKHLLSQFSITKAVVEAFNIPIFEKAGFEADDVIGTLVKKTQKENDVVIVTGDKDILQLVTKKTKVYLPIRGLSVAELMGEDEVYEKMGVTPKQIIDYKALVGDPSDNYPGVRGIGPKTATNLISEYGDLKNIYKNINKISETTAKKLRSGKDLAKISYKLAKIVTNVPLKFKLDKAVGWEVDSEKVLSEFSKLGFKTLSKRAKMVGEGIRKEKQMKLL